MPVAYDFIAIGGGAAGFFGAIAFAEARPGSRVAILEKTNSVLGKVKISGGGRCNVTHACFEPKPLTTRYPRGERSLIGPFHRWGAADTVEWFESRGVKLKTEADGRMFPVTNLSDTIIDCLMDAAEDAGIEILFRTDVESLVSDKSGIILHLAGGGDLEARSVLLATGGVRNGAGQKLAGALGHTIIPAAPSLFTFKIDDSRLKDLAGVSVASVKAKIPGTALRSEGPCLVTHWGLSGPAILKLSAWGARELSRCDYRFEVVIDWTPGLRSEALDETLSQMREASPRKRISSGVEGLTIPSRLWQKLVSAAGIDQTTTWSNLLREQRRALVSQLTASTFRVEGKSTNKEEFVTAGGVELKEVNFKTMESKVVPGLHFAGEVLDIDGITGGFNFQAAWTTSKIAGESAAQRD
ncbi:MAG: NAD(P)/FAD-dependent oxidoreductase [Verrucomicrobiales bacterium]|nr:NAD(P)/FAD-dependent oxidoreductase [Verrucomicrobiales bacterium]